MVERAAELGWGVTETGEFKAALGLAALISTALRSSAFVEWRSKKGTQAIAQAKTPRDLEWHAGRAVRTIGFATDGHRDALAGVPQPGPVERVQPP